MTDETNAASSTKEDKKEPLEPVPATAAKDYVWTGPDGATRRYELGPDQGFLICPGLVNTYFADKHDPWKYVWLEFGGLRAEEYLGAAGLGPVRSRSAGTAAPAARRTWSTSAAWAPCASRPTAWRT